MFFTTIKTREETTMAVKIILASVAASVLLSSTAFAQVQNQIDNRFEPRIYGSTTVAPVNYGQTQHTQSTTINRVVEPVTPNFQRTILAAPKYSQSDVVRAQHFKPGDLSDTEYQALLDEADRVRAYQDNNGYITDDYTNEITYGTQNHAETTYDAGTTTVYPSNGSYEIELFEPSTSNTVTYAETTPVQTYSNGYASSNTFTASHQVLKGDTLYNISKRYSVSIDSLKSANYMSDNNIGIGQVLNIPQSTTTVSQNTYITPVTTVSTDTNLTYIRNVEPIAGQNSIYAVLPKDTLYSISRRACVKVADLIAVNAISSPGAIQPGQRLTMPEGHCLN